MPDLTGRRALVTGSSRGIGAAIACRLAAEGAAVAVNYAGSENAARSVVESIRATGGTAVAFKADISDAAAASELVERAHAELGGLDVLVNNAGITRDGLLVRMSDDDWRSVIDTNLTGAFNTTRPAAKLMMKARAGSIVTIASVVGITGNAGQANYSAGKAAVIGLTKAMAKEWGRYKINVNCVAFGLIKTRLTEATAGSDESIDIEGRKIKVGVNPDLLRNMEAMVPLGRSGTPAEAAGAVYLFCTPESNYVSGQTLICGGGFSM